MNLEEALQKYRAARERHAHVLALEDLSARKAQLDELQAEWHSAIQRLLSESESGNVEVWHTLGDAYSSERGVSRDKEAAVRWYSRAADAGYTPAMVALGIILRHPDTPESHEAAIAWLLKAAELGDARGCSTLGFCYRDGRGVPAEPTTAIHWFSRAADLGDVGAIAKVAKIFSYPLKNLCEAEKWFCRAVEAGDFESCYDLGAIYSDRKSTRCNPVEAVKWFPVTKHGRSCVDGANGERMARMEDC